MVNCLRALSQYNQETGNNRITWGNTEDSDWKRDKRMTVRSISPEYREGFLSEVRRLLLNSLWTEYVQSDKDPVRPAK